MRHTAVVLTLIGLFVGCSLTGESSTAGGKDGQGKKVLIVTGIDYPGHKWKLTAPVLAQAIAADNRLEVTVTGEQEAEPPWTYRTIHVHYAVRGRGLKEKAVRDAIELSQQKYCSIAATCREAAEVTFDYSIAEDE